MSEDILNRLYQVLQARKTADPDESYVASLYAKGMQKIAGKLGEEAVETVIEAVALQTDPKARERLKSESADLIFHWLVLLAHYDIAPEEIFAILKERFGTGGLAEKASRGK